MIGLLQNPNPYITEEHGALCPRVANVGCFGVQQPKVRHHLGAIM